MPRKYVRHKEPDRSPSYYKNFSTDLGGLICVACHEPIRNQELAFVLNHGSQSDKYPLQAFLRFTGLAWHAGPSRGGGRKKPCIDIAQLPGMAGRDEIDIEYQKASEGSSEMASLKIGALLSPQSKATH